MMVMLHVGFPPHFQGVTFCFNHLEVDVIRQEWLCSHVSAIHRPILRRHHSCCLGALPGAKPKFYLINGYLEN